MPTVLPFPRAAGLPRTAFQTPARRRSHQSPRLPWLNGVLLVHASATCFFKVSSVTASENSAITSFLPLFPPRHGPASAGRFPFISAQSQATLITHLLLPPQRLQFPECLQSYVLQRYPMENAQAMGGGAYN